MFFAHFRNAQKEDCGGIYYDHTDGPYCEGWTLYHKETFNPETEHVSFIDFHVHGKTYAEKKESVRDIAIDYQAAWHEYCFSYSEIAAIGNWLERMGRRYGLLREFRENCIC